MTHLFQRATRRAPVLLVTVVAMLAVAPAASAHATLLRSSPADRSSTATAPKTVSLTFDENIRMPSVIVVTDANGASVVQGKTSVVDNIVSTHVRIAASGDYAAVYRVVSSDGHPVSGRISFTVGTGGGGATAHSSDPVAAATADHHHGTSTGPPARVIGMVAALALLGGIGLLTIRRWAPNLWTGS